MQYPPSNTYVEPLAIVDLIRACACVAAQILFHHITTVMDAYCDGRQLISLHIWAILCLVIPMVIRQFINLNQRQMLPAHVCKLKFMYSWEISQLYDKLRTMRL